jgi:hypothetical protein
MELKFFPYCIHFLMKKVFGQENQQNINNLALNMLCPFLGEKTNLKFVPL